MSILITLLVAIFVLGASFLVSAGVVKLLAFCFGFVFTWKLALGLWVLFLIITGIFKGGK